MTQIICPHHESSELKFYTVKGNGGIGFICRDNYKDGIFRARAVTELTKGNNWDGVTVIGDTLIETIANLMNNNFEVFEFDEPNEFFSWLSTSTHA
jgi:hypothetical protein